MATLYNVIPRPKQSKEVNLNKLTNIHKQFNKINNKLVTRKATTNSKAKFKVTFNNEPLQETINKVATKNFKRVAYFS